MTFAPGSMQIVSRPEAGEELEGAALWYEERQPGLADDFIDEFERTLARIVASPESRRKKVAQFSRKKICKLKSEQPVG